MQGSISLRELNNFSARNLLQLVLGSPNMIRGIFLGKGYNEIPEKTLMTSTGDFYVLIQEYFKLRPFKGLFQIRALFGTTSNEGLIRDLFKLGPHCGLVRITASSGSIRA